MAAPTLAFPARPGASAVVSAMQATSVPSNLCRRLNCGRSFAGAVICQLAALDARHLDPVVIPIQKQTRDALLLAGDGAHVAGSVADRVPTLATWARVLRRGQRKRVTNGALCCRLGRSSASHGQIIAPMGAIW